MADDSQKLIGKKVFLIEDDEFFRTLVDRKLSASQCVFSMAASGEEGLKYLETNTPDVILLDIMLPGGIDGFTVLEKIKKDDRLKNIPVIILSNLGRAEDIERGMNLGAFRYLVKASIVPSEILDNLVSVFS